MSSDIDIELLRGEKTAVMTDYVKYSAQNKTWSFLN